MSNSGHHLYFCIRHCIYICLTTCRYLHFVIWNGYTTNKPIKCFKAPCGTCDELSFEFSWYLTQLLSVGEVLWNPSWREGSVMLLVHYEAGSYNAHILHVFTAILLLHQHLHFSISSNIYFSIHCYFLKYSVLYFLKHSLLYFLKHSLLYFLKHSHLYFWNIHVSGHS